MEDQWNQARQLEDAMVAETFYSFACACCGHRCPHSSDVQISLTDASDPNISEMIISCETETIKRPSRIYLSTSSNDYVIHDSYIVMSPLMHIKYLTIGYHVSGEKYTPQRQLSRHITAFPKPLPCTIKEALEEHFSLSISQIESIIQMVLITAVSDDEAREKAKNIEGMQISVFWLDLRCKHIVEVWRDSNIEDLIISMSFDLLDEICVIKYDFIVIFQNLLIVIFILFFLFAYFNLK
jgi:hypothetical protein